MQKNIVTTCLQYMSQRHSNCKNLFKLLYNVVKSARRYQRDIKVYDLKRENDPTGAQICEVK